MDLKWLLQKSIRARHGYFLCRTIFKTYLAQSTIFLQRWVHFIHWNKIKLHEIKLNSLLNQTLCVPFHNISAHVFFVYTSGTWYTKHKIMIFNFIGYILYHKHNRSVPSEPKINMWCAKFVSILESANTNHVSNVCNSSLLRSIKGNVMIIAEFSNRCRKVNFLVNPEW